MMCNEQMKNLMFADDIKIPFDPTNPNNISLITCDLGMLRDYLMSLKENEISYKALYGDEWWDYYTKGICQKPGVDYIEEIVNAIIYDRWWPVTKMPLDPKISAMIVRRYRRKLKQLFGRHWKEYMDSNRYSSKQHDIENALIRDARKTGKWQELPLPLREKYRKWQEIVKEYKKLQEDNPDSLINIDFEL